MSLIFSTLYMKIHIIQNVLQNVLTLINRLCITICFKFYQSNILAITLATKAWVPKNCLLKWVATQRKEPYVGKVKIEFCIASSRGYSADHFGTKIMYLAQFLTELLRILSFKTCIMKN